MKRGQVTIGEQWRWQFPRNRPITSWTDLYMSSGRPQLPREERIQMLLKLISPNYGCIIPHLKGKWGKPYKLFKQDLEVMEQRGLLRIEGRSAILIAQPEPPAPRVPEPYKKRKEAMAELKAAIAARKAKRRKP